MLEPLTGSRRWIKASLVGFSIAASVGISTGAQASFDLLEIPSVMAPQAAKALSLNITSRGNHVVAVGERGIILRRVEGQEAPEGAVKDSQGNWWLQGKVPVSINLTSVAFASDDLLFAVGHDGVILKSVDGGQEWRVVFDGNDANEQVVKDAEKVYEQAKERIEAQLDALPDEEARTEEEHALADQLNVELEDRMFAFEDAEAGARFGPARPMLDVWFKDDQTGWVVGSYGQIFETQDGGESWTLISNRLDNPDYRHYNGLYGDQTGLMLIAGEAGRVYRSVDFGQNWERIDTSYIGHLYGTAVIRGQNDQVTVVAYGFAGNVFRLGPGADKWWQLKSPSDKSIVGASTTSEGVTLVDQLGRLIQSDKTGIKLKMVTQKEGKSVTGMTRVGDKLILSAQGGPRALAVAQ